MRLHYAAAYPVYCIMRKPKSPATLYLLPWSFVSAYKQKHERERLTECHDLEVETCVQEHGVRDMDSAHASIHRSLAHTSVYSKW